MLYENLLHFIVSNYLNRGEAIEVLKNFALTREDAFGIITDAVKDLANFNTATFAWMVGGFTIAIMLAIFFAGYFNFRSVKEAEEKFDNQFKEYEDKLEITEKCLEDMKAESKASQLDFENTNRKTEERLVEFGNKLKRELLKQAAESQYNLYLSVGIQDKPIFTFLSYIGYLIIESEYYLRFKVFCKKSDFDEIVKEVREIFSEFKRKGSDYNKEEHIKIKEIFNIFAKIPQFKESSLEIIKESEDLSKQQTL
ncbi:MAG: hypothetical protein PHO48_03620 [Candidatus Gracilibacteria bacterium]|nr:hypothetical protein [Candidatus Gracilibacteria bacterium]